MTQPDYDFEKKRVNILLLGADSSTERISAGMNFRTDTMILVTVDFDNKDVDMISIPRDTSYANQQGRQVQQDQRSLHLWRRSARRTAMPTR